MESSKRVLAYQQSPLILLCERSGAIPEDFLVSLTSDEREYVRARSQVPLEPVFFDLLSRLQAAGIQPQISSLLLDVFSRTPRLFLRVEEVSFALAEDSSTQQWLVKDFYEPFVADVRRLVESTKRRFDHTHVIQLAQLPRFLNGSPVSHEIVTFGDSCLKDAVHEPEGFESLVDNSALSEWSENWTWVGVHPKFFATDSLREQLLKRLSNLSCGALVKN